MKTIQCGSCLRYRGDLACDAFPDRIPEKILTGEHDHTNEYDGDHGIRFSDSGLLHKSASVEGSALSNYVDDLIQYGEAGYSRAKETLVGKGYIESDFEDGGPLHRYSTAQLLGLLGE